MKNNYNVECKMYNVGNDALVVPNSNKGITLVALVVTIIVLIILAAVTINLLLGENGIITRAREGTANYKKAEQAENEGLASLVDEMENQINGVSGGTINPETPTLPKTDGSWQEGTDYSTDGGVNSPDVSGGLTPVYYDEGTSTWKELTDSSTEAEWKNWYKYEIQSSTTEAGGTSRWANAKTANGSYLVWIPRYEYKITSGEHTGAAGVIDVNFISTTDATTSGYTIHPAFTNSGNGGLGELAGIWVGKFESSNDGSGNVKIVPNVEPYVSINVSTMFAKSQAFGISNGLTGYDSRMMKNTEWGAVRIFSP